MPSVVNPTTDGARYLADAVPLALKAITRMAQRLL
jgi:hypothetical protein